MSIDVDIIGPGALGLHLALALPADTRVRLRHPLFSRQRVQLAYATDGHSHAQRDVETLPLDDPSPVHCALFTTKAFHVVPALRSLQHALTDTSSLVLLHNGIGPQEAVCELHNGPVWVGTTTEGALRTAPWQVKHTGRGKTLIGPWRSNATQPLTSAPTAVQLLADSQWSATWEPSADIMQQHLWRKVIINCAINPLTALHNLRNGDLLAPPWRTRWQDIVTETLAVTKALHLPFTATALLADVERVMHDTAQNYSSMHQDWQHRRQTEADFILGAVIREGARLGIATPILNRLLQDIAAGQERR